MKHSILLKLLVDIFHISDRRIPAFRARVRNLRDLNIPSVTGMGSGYHTNYSRAHVFELALALALENLGVPPAAAAACARCRAPEVLAVDLKNKNTQDRVESFIVHASPFFADDDDAPDIIVNGIELLESLDSALEKYGEAPPL